MPATTPALGFGSILVRWHHPPDCRNLTIINTVSMPSEARIRDGSVTRMARMRATTY